MRGRLESSTIVLERELRGQCQSLRHTAGPVPCRTPTLRPATSNLFVREREGSTGDEKAVVTTQMYNILMYNSDVHHTATMVFELDPNCARNFNFFIHCAITKNSVNRCETKINRC